MKDKCIDVPFTKPVHKFLMSRGFTHLLSLGINPKESDDAGESETGKENYWLEPLKADDPRLSYQETEQLIQGIKESDVYDMSDGQDEIGFMITVPVEDYELYLKDRQNEFWNDFL